MVKPNLSKIKEDFDTVIQDVFLGPIPYMTDKATFVINGAERVVVSQLHRSPGVFFGQSMHANGTQLYSARIIPFKGSWIEFATDINNVMYAYIDRKKKLPVTTLLRAIGFENDKDILEIFGLAEEVEVKAKTINKYIGRQNNCYDWRNYTAWKSACNWWSARKSPCGIPPWHHKGYHSKGQCQRP